MFSHLYNLFIGDVNDLCYRSALDYLPERAAILDVGIGNGAMLKRYHGVIRAKHLKITGIDINGPYLRHCRDLIRRHGLEEAIDVHHAPVESYCPPADRCFDFIFFSMSFMLFKDPSLVLDRVKAWLKPGGGVLFFQTVFRERSLLMDVVKPRLKYVTSVDFGRVTYERDFFRLLAQKELAVREDRLLRRNLFKGEYRFIVSAPGNGAATSSPPPPGGPPRGPSFPRGSLHGRSGRSCSSCGSSTPWASSAPDP